MSYGLRVLFVFRERRPGYMNFFPEKTLEKMISIERNDDILCRKFLHSLCEILRGFPGKLDEGVRKRCCARVVFECFFDVSGHLCDKIRVYTSPMFFNVFSDNLHRLLKEE